MNETENDLRDLFETKAREAGPAPRVTPEILRRGRRRQVGTVAVAGITAVAVAAAAIVSLQALRRADTDTVPGGRDGNPPFTATIQNFTVTVPEGWTLIDQWPLGSNLAVEGSGGTSFSCVGTPIEAGSGKNTASGPATSDCPAQQMPERPTIPEGGLPMLTLSNDDPGLGGSVCRAGSSLPATAARLYIGLDYGVTRTAGWESMAAWPNPLVNVLEGDLPVEQMPCGPGGYSWFQAGGAPYIAWAGFGSEVTAADRQALLDVFDGMQVSDGEITPPAGDMPAYVLAGGPGGEGSWASEAGPTETNIELTYREFPLRPLAGGPFNVSGVVDFIVPDVPIEIGRAKGTVYGAVTFDAERVELRPADGSAPVPGSILQLPESLGAPFDAFLIPSSTAGEVVAVGPDGDLGSAPVGDAPTPGPSAAVTASGSAAPSQPVESSVDLQGFGVPATLTVRRETAKGCLTLEIQIGNDQGTGMGSCVNGPMRPDEPLAVIQPAVSGDRVSVVSGYVPPEADRVFFLSDDGTRTDAPILYILQVEPRVQFFAFSVPLRSGQLHVEDVNGVELSAPIPLGRTA